MTGVVQTEHSPTTASLATSGSLAILSRDGKIFFEQHFDSAVASHPKVLEFFRRDDVEQSVFLDGSMRYILSWTEVADEKVVVVQGESLTDGASELLETLRHYYERILEASSMAILVTDCLGTITRVNAAHERLTGRPRKKIIGKSLYQDYAVKATAEIREAFSRAVTAGESTKFAEYEYASSSRGQVYFDISLSPIVDQNHGVVGVVQIMVDVTTEVQLTRQLQDRVTELRGSYVELGRKNRQLTSLMDAISTTIRQLTSGQPPTDPVAQRRDMLLSLSSLLEAKVCVVKLDTSGGVQTMALSPTREKFQLGKKSRQRMNALLDTVCETDPDLPKYFVFDTQGRSVSLDGFSLPQSLRGVITSGLIVCGHGDEGDGFGFFLGFSSKRVLEPFEQSVVQLLAEWLRLDMWNCVVSKHGTIDA